MRPIGDRIIVRRKKAAEKIGSFYVPESATEKPSEGEIVALGAGVKDKSLRIGDPIQFGKYSGFETNINGEELLILREEEILVVI